MGGGGAAAEPLAWLRGLRFANQRKARHAAGDGRCRLRAACDADGASGGDGGLPSAEIVQCTGAFGHDWPAWAAAVTWRFFEHTAELRERAEAEAEEAGAEAAKQEAAKQEAAAAHKDAASTPGALPACVADEIERDRRGHGGKGSGGGGGGPHGGGSGVDGIRGRPAADSTCTVDTRVDGKGGGDEGSSAVSPHGTAGVRRPTPHAIVAVLIFLGVTLFGAWCAWCTRSVAGSVRARAAHTMNATPPHTGVGGRSACSVHVPACALFVPRARPATGALRVCSVHRPDRGAVRVRARLRCGGGAGASRVRARGRSTSRRRPPRVSTR